MEGSANLSAIEISNLIQKKMPEGKMALKRYANEFWYKYIFWGSYTLEIGLR